LLVAVACSKENSSPTPTAPSCTVTAGAITTSSFGPAGVRPSARHGWDRVHVDGNEQRPSSRFRRAPPPLQRHGDFAVAANRRGPHLR
jgi:hypothetical protein